VTRSSRPPSRSARSPAVGAGSPQVPQQQPQGLTIDVDRLAAAIDAKIASRTDVLLRRFEQVETTCRELRRSLDDFGAEQVCPAPLLIFGKQPPHRPTQTRLAVAVTELRPSFASRSETFVKAATSSLADAVGTLRREAEEHRRLDDVATRLSYIRDRFSDCARTSEQAPAP
jgi:hypothetical protein